MTFARLSLAAILTLSATTVAGAQETARLDDLDAERRSGTEVQIEFEYDGGACETVGTAQLGAITDGTLAVTFPTTSTADVCTQQVVEHEVEQVVAADETVKSVEVTLLRPDGTVWATGKEEVDD